MLRPLPTVVLIAHVFLVAALSAAESPATRIASAVIHERARDLRSGGQPAVAAQLEILANGLSDGSVTLADAALVMQIATASGAARTTASSTPTPPPTPSLTLTGPPVPAKPAEPPTTPAQVTDILDGKAPTPAPTAAPTGPTSTVLAASRAGDGKTTLVMISAGSDQQVKTSQRFTVRRGDLALGVISASQVKETMTICVAIPGSGPADVEIKEGDQVVPAP